MPERHDPAPSRGNGQVEEFLNHSFGVTYTVIKDLQSEKSYYQKIKNQA